MFEFVLGLVVGVCLTIFTIYIVDLVIARKLSREIAKVIDEELDKLTKEAMEDVYGKKENNN